MNVSFRLRGKSTTIYVRLYANENRFERKTGLTINPKEWNADTQRPNNWKKDTDRKIIKNKLDRLADYLENSYNSNYSNGVEIDGDWLQEKINEFNGQKKAELSELFTHHIQNYIDNAPLKQTRKKVGLSEGRIRNLKLFKNTWERFEEEKRKNKPIETSKINNKTVREFKDWLHSQDYSINYIGKNLSNLKAVLNDVQKNNDEVKLSFNPLSIEVPHESKEPEDIIYLNFEELEKIKELKLTNNYLENARKWMILGCYVGQRGSDLMSLSTDKIKIINERKAFVIRQQKTRKDTVIPILPEAERIINSGFPHPISLEKLREYYKKLCKLAEINELKKGVAKDDTTGKRTKGMHPKWKLIGSHVCRRSFASNYYGTIPTPVLMQITNHSSEATFLQYIGKPPYEYAMQMLDYVEKLPKTKTLRVVKDEKTGTDNN